MKDGIGTWIVYGIIAIVLFYVVRWILSMIFSAIAGILVLAINIAIVVGIIYLLVMIFGRKRAVY
jgi:hypothetical protein